MGVTGWVAVAIVAVAIVLAFHEQSLRYSHNIHNEWHWKENPIHVVDNNIYHEYPNFELPCESNPHLIGWVWEGSYSHYWYGLVYKTGRFSTAREAKIWVENEMEKYCKK